MFGRLLSPHAYNTLKFSVQFGAVSSFCLAVSAFANTHFNHHDPDIIGTKWEQRLPSPNVHN